MSDNFFKGWFIFVAIITAISLGVGFYCVVKIVHHVDKALELYENNP